MENLSQEISDTILSFVAREDFINYACVCRQFRNTVERETFQSIRLKSTEVDKFHLIFRSRRRKSLLRYLIFIAILPQYEKRHRAKIERERDRSVNNLVFSDAIANLFKLLKLWEGQESGDETHQNHGLDISITAWCLSDLAHRMSSRQSGDDSDDRGPDIRHERYKRSFLEVLSVESLPRLRNVTSFRVLRGYQPHIVTSGDRFIDPACIAALAHKMDSLESIEWWFSDAECWAPFMEARRQRRYSFARKLSELDLASLTSFKLTFEHKEPYNQGIELPNALRAEDRNEDPLSLALHALTQSPNLREFEIDKYTSISPTFFWPMAIDPSQDQTIYPLWPSLRRFRIFLCPVTPQGTWLWDKPATTPSDFDHDPGEPSDNEEYENDSQDSDQPDYAPCYEEIVATGLEPLWEFRTSINESAFVEWIKRMELATRYMPKLITGILCFSMPDYEVRLDVECRKATDDGRTQWMMELSRFVTSSPSPEIICYLEESSGGSVVVDEDVVYGYIRSHYENPSWQGAQDT